ncbi:MAG TPA: outer membrane beta-barrel protein [Steroidobacter sp.]
MHRAMIAALIASLASTGAWAQTGNDEGFYLGGGVGQFNVDIDDIDDTDEAIERLDDDDTAWKAFIGWRLNPYFALELAYIDFGAPSDRFEASGSSGDFELDVSGFAPYLIGTWPIGPVELFAKVGYYFYDVDVSIDIDDPTAPDFDSSADDEDLLYGFGVGLTFFERLHARLEYEKIDSDVLDDADAIWLSGAWRF